MRVYILLLISASAFAGGPMNLHGEFDDFDSSHCWQTFETGLSAPILITHHPGTPPAGQSPGINLSGDGISPSGADPQLAVSPNYVMVLTNSRYAFYDRSTNMPLTANGCVPVNGSFKDLFAPFMLDTTPDGAPNANYINLPANLGAQTIWQCNSAGDDGCVDDVYDARAYYDHVTGRFWIVAAARNGVVRCQDDDPGCKNCVDNQFCYQPSSGSPRCKDCEADATRFMFVAVSKTADPRNGFWEYVLVRDYGDWPLFSVRNHRLLMAHKNDTTNLFVFNTDKMINGYAGNPFLRQYTASDFPESTEITPVTQYSDADGLSLVLGHDDGSKLTVYAFTDPANPPVKRSVTLSPKPRWSMQPVYRYGKFYFTTAPQDSSGSRHHVEVHRLTAQLDGSPPTVGALSDEPFTVPSTNGSLRMSGTSSEESGSMIVWYLLFPADGSAMRAEYRVMFPQDNAFRSPVVMRTSDKVQTESEFMTGVDGQLGGASDPGSVGFWITHIYAAASGGKRQALARIDPGCGGGGLSMCSNRCVDMQHDNANCGQCGNICGPGATCGGGICQVPK